MVSVQRTDSVVICGSYPLRQVSLQLTWVVSRFLLSVGDVALLKIIFILAYLELIWYALGIF